MAVMRPALSDTVFGVAAGGRHSALTVMRVSGPRCGQIVAGLGGGRLVPRSAVLRSLRDGAGRLLDRAIVLWFPGPRSYTGEDCAELQLHGGAAVLDGVVRALAEAGARPAEAGEFTRRAFANGRIDLLEAEAIADLVASETDAQRDQALLQMQGAVGEIYAGWQNRLARTMAALEAEIDFPDEIGQSNALDVAKRECVAIGAEISLRIENDAAGERLRTGLSIAVMGAPNVGKSTLVNALCAREISIVSAMPGTTRDPVEGRQVLGGVPVTFIDTAGLRETSDPVEQEGIRRARGRARTADLVLLVTDGSLPDPLELCDDMTPVIRVRNKLDTGHPAPDRINVSATRGDGLAELKAALTVAALRLARGRAVPALTRPRHSAALRDAAVHLASARLSAEAEFAAEDVRLAMHCLARVTGAVETEDVLDLLFSQFCIGK